jgi:tetratricopeptide (TPR) repeat protein
MRILQRPSAGTGPGRNELCPCGSGRKYKHCCAGKRLGLAAPVGSVQPPRDELARVRGLRGAGRFLEAARLAEAYTRRNPTDAEGHAALGLVHFYAGRAAEALPYLLRATRLAPKVAQHHHDAGWALEALGRDAEAMTAFQYAVDLDDRHFEALERLGDHLLANGNNKEAIECFRRIADREPGTVRGRINRGKVLQEEGRQAEVEALLAQSVALYPANPELKRFLAAVLREQGRFEEAIPLLEQATKGKPVETEKAYFDLVMSKRIGKDDRPVVERMEALLDYRSLPDVSRQRIHFGLGKACDDLADYAAAMRHYDMANRLAARGRPFDRAHFGAYVHRTIASATAEFFHEYADLGSPSELPVLVLGMPRSGTTLVEQILSSHPQVGGGGELPFWNEAAHEFARLGAAAITPAHAGRVAADYEAVLRGIAPAARRVTDKTPGNYVWIGLFHLVFPRGRIIHCRRDPVDTCLSNYFANFTAPMPYTYDKGHLAFVYKCYRRLMAHWRAVLPPGTMLEVDYEELVADPEQVTRKMIDFIGLEWDDACLRPQDNQRLVRTASMWQARQPVYRRSVERWRRYEPWLGELRELLDEDDAGGDVDPTSDNAKIPLARRLRDAGRLDEAVSALQEGLRELSYDPVIYNELGTLCLMTNRVDEAVDGFERAIGLNPNFAVAYYNLGAAMERQGRPADAVAALRKAIALKPDLGSAYSRLGNLLETQGEHDEAMVCFRRASELLTSPAERDLEEAKLLLGEGRSAEAEPLLRNAIALDPDNSLAHAIFGDLLGHMGRLTEAVTLLRKATELDPDRVGAWHNMTILTKVSAADQPLVERMTEMLQQPRRTDFERAMLHFALGKAHDDLGETKQAIGHFDQGNVLERKKLTFDRAALAAGVDRLIETFTADYFARYAAVGVTSELPVFVLGMPRSGTTLVEQIVSAHPAVAPGGELTFWSDHQEAPGGAQTVRQFADEYLALLRGIGPDAARVTDKNPYNFLSLGLIRLALPRARVIHCRRDPIDTCLSVYFTRFAVPQPFAYDRGDLVFYYRQYARLMTHWRAALPADRLLEVEYEALTADPEALTRRIVAFCGLPWDDACLRPEQNQGLVKTASVWQARQPVYRTSVERWRRYEPWLGELRELHTGAA